MIVALSKSSFSVQDASPLTTIAFSSSGDGLIAANASNHIGVYNVESLAATDWTRTVGSNLPARLLDIPGSIASISVNPQVACVYIPKCCRWSPLLADSDILSLQAAVPMSAYSGCDVKFRCVQLRQLMCF